MYTPSRMLVRASRPRWVSGTGESILSVSPSRNGNHAGDGGLPVVLLIDVESKRRPAQRPGLKHFVSVAGRFRRRSTGCRQCAPVTFPGFIIGGPDFH